VDIAVVVNLKARRGSESVARSCRAELPDARVLASRSLEEAIGFARDLRESPPELLLSAGGDGTAVALLNALRGPEGARPFGAAFGVLPLGTGNGWARATGAPSWKAALAGIGRAARRPGPLPVRRFDLVEVCGTIAHFAGTGWDAEIIDDFHAQKTGPGVLPEKARAGLGGYLQGLFTRTIPRHLLVREQVEVELVNTGEDALGVDENGRAYPLPGGEHGKVLYRGPTNVCAAGTSPEWGFGFRAFPFAELVPRRFCMRIYAGKAFEATMNMGKLWRGQHPMPKMHTWLLTRCHATFSRPVPFQIGGDRLGHKTDVDYALAPEQVDLVDWRALRAA
jgi:diacylglycerol kinase family enzyme